MAERGAVAWAETAPAASANAKRAGRAAGLKLLGVGGA
jgi:hypothetical protein